MNVIKRKSGQTYLDAIFAATIGIIMVLGMSNLIITVYKGLNSGKLKTVAFTVATEALETLKHYSFSALNVTPDAILPAPLSNLNSSTNPWPVQTVKAEGSDFTVYRVVQYAVENADGSIVPALIDDVNTYDASLKMITVYVAYIDGKSVKQTQLISYVSNKTVNSGGTSITGVIKTSPTATITTAMQLYVYVSGHPEYTVPYDCTNKKYTIYNVMPGTYNLYAQGIGLQTTSYASNPITITDTSQALTGINLTLPKVATATFTGYVTYNGLPCSGVRLYATDGISLEDYTDSDGMYTIPGINPGTSVTLNATGIQTFTFATKAPVAANTTYYINLTLAPTAGQAIVQGKVYDSINRTTGLNGVVVFLRDTVTYDATTYTVVTAGSGSYTLNYIPIGQWVLSASATDSVIEDQKIISVVSGTNTTNIPNLYMIGVGSVNGTISDVTGNSLPDMSVQVISNYGAGSAVASAYSNSLGAYVITGVPAGSNYALEVALSGTDYTVTSPLEGFYNRLSLAKGGTLSNKNFILKVNFRTISGSLPSALPAGAPPSATDFMIVAVPSGVTLTPHYWTRSDEDTGFETGMVRRLYPYYSTITEPRDVSFTVQVPATGNVDIYAYYSYVSMTAKPKTPVRYYMSITNIAPASTTANFGSTWTSY